MPRQRRRRARRTILGLLAAPLLVVTSFTASAHGAAAAPDKPSQVADPEVAQLQRLGLSQRDAEQRVAGRPDRERWIAARQEHPPHGFAGLSYDAQADAIDMYGTDGQALQAASQDAPARTRAHEVALTLEELDAAAEEASAALLRTAPFPRAGEISVRTDPARARVYLDLAENVTESTRQRAVDFAASRPHVEVVANSPQVLGPVTCGVQSCNPPLRAGVANQIYESPALGNQCTSGFNAVSRVDGKKYVLMAAHCQNGFSYNLRWAEKFENGESHVIGSRWNGQYSGDVDAQIVTINDPSGWQEQPYVVNGTATYQVTGYYNNFEYYVGMYLCHTGYKTGTQCGNVTNLNATVSDGQGHSVNNQVLTNACALPGDSGGPMFLIDNANMTRRAAGVVSAGNNTVGATCAANTATGFSRMESVQNALNVNVDTTYHDYTIV